MKHALQRIAAQHLPGEQMVEEETLPWPSGPVPCGLRRTAGGTVDADTGCSGHADGIQTEPGAPAFCRAKGGLSLTGGAEAAGRHRLHGHETAILPCRESTTQDAESIALRGRQNATDV